MAPSPVAVGTIVAKNFLCFARVLADSVRAHHPDVPFFTVLADEPGDLFDAGAEAFEVLPIEALGVPDLRQICFRYTRQQLSIAIKPYLLRYVLDRGFTSAVFLDADILVTGSLDRLFAAAAEHAIVLTPHILAHVEQNDRVARELNILQSGIYNGGCMAVSSRPSARSFLSWWADRLRTHCRHDIPAGMHFDQRWLDLVPAIFDDVLPLRDQGCNVAYWNLPERSPLLDPRQVASDVRSCRFFHFSGFEPEKPAVVTRYSTRLGMDTIGPASKLFDRYVSLLMQAGFETTRYWPYAYGAFDNGVAIPDLARSLYLEMDESACRFGDPFGVEGADSYFCWLNEPVEGCGDTGRSITRIWESVYRSRPDLRSAFPDVFGADREAFLSWTSTSGLQEHQIPAAFVETTATHPSEAFPARPRLSP